MSDKENAVQQAQIWAQEARTQRHTVLSILRFFGLPERDYEALTLIQAKDSEARAAMLLALDALEQVTTSESFFRDPRGDCAGPAIDALRAVLTSGVTASGLPAWVDGLRDFMERNGRTTEEIGNVLIAAGFATRGVLASDGSQPTDTQMLDFIASEYLDVTAFSMPTGAGDADVGWKLTQGHEGKKGRVEVAIHYRDDLRAAIREAMKNLGWLKRTHGKAVLTDEAWRAAEASTDPFLRCGCGAAMPCAEHFTHGVGAVAPALPRSDSKEAADGIEAVMAERDYPCAPKNAARAGWEAAFRWLRAHGVKGDGNAQR